jgi:hypothetical protein
VITPNKTVQEPEAGEWAHDVAIAEFIRTRGVTRCPTACLLPTQASVAAADQAALAQHAQSRERRRRERAARQGAFLPFASPRSPS